MRWRTPALLALAVVALGVALSACSPNARGRSGSAPGVGLTVYAAASLHSALVQVASAYEVANPGTTLTISTDSSAALEAKIEQGAPADVFLSADTANPQKLLDKGLAAGAVVPFAGNALTVIVAPGNPAGIRTPLDLAREGVKVVAAGDAVPITEYADQVVARLAEQPGYPSDYAARYGANVVTREDNVSAVVAKVELGEGDAGIAYLTDAQASHKVGTVALPDAADVKATYGGVVVKASPKQAAAAAFLAWLAAPHGQRILAGFGFTPHS